MFIKPGENYPVWTFYGTRVALQMRTSALFGAKTSEFSKFMMCPRGQGDMSSADILRSRGRGVNF